MFNSFVYPEIITTVASKSYMSITDNRVQPVISQFNTVSIKSNLIIYNGAGGSLIHRISSGARKTSKTKWEKIIETTTTLI